MKDLRRLLALYRPYRAWIALGIALSTATALSNVALLALSGWFIASMALAGLGTQLFNFFTPAAAIRGLAILRSLARYLERLVTHDATLRLLSELRTWFYERLEPLAPAGLRIHRRGDLLSRMRADIDSLDNFYLRILAPSASAALSLMLLTGFLATFSLPIAAVTAAGLLIAGVGLPLLMLGLGRRAGGQAVALRGALRAAVTDGTRGAAELRAFGATPRQTARIDALSDRLIDRQRHLARLKGVSVTLSTLTAPLAMVAALLLAIPMVGRGDLSPPDTAMIALFVLAAFEAIATLPPAFQALGETLAAARRIFEIADTPAPVADPSAPEPTPTRHDIRAKGLCLRYRPQDALALDHLSLHLQQGEVLALKGLTGAGKTSIFNAILRFHDYQSGSLQIGGTEVSALSGAQIRGLCAVVDQHGHLFNATIRDNLRLARPEADDAALRRALEDAALWEEVRAFPRGLDTFVGEAGARLSGGQARRLIVARALLKDAPILLLDEPTENLDAASEDRVIAALRRLVAGRTVLLISHRPRTLALADRVLTIDKGRVAAPSPKDRRTRVAHA